MFDLIAALDNGFHFEYTNQTHKELVKEIIKSRNLEEILDKINNVNDIIFVISNTSIHKLPLLRSLIYNNSGKILKVINSPYINEEHINFIIDSIPLEKLKENTKILELAIKKGYKVNEYTLEIIENNINLLIQKIENITEINELLEIINHLSEKTLENNLIVNLAITKGYYFTKDTPNILRNNKEVLKRILGFIYSNDRNNNNIIETINNVNPNILDEQIMNIAKDKLGYTLTVNSPLEKINEIYEKYYNEYLKQFKNKTKEKYIKLGQILGKGIIYYEKENPLFSKEVVDTFGELAVSKIYKYHTLLGKKINFEYLIKNNNLEKFKYLFTVISDNNDNFKTFNMLLFINFLEKYEKYGNLCFEFISKYGISEETRKILKILLINKYKNLDIKNIEDLKNINQIIKENNEKTIQNNNKLEIKNIIILMLCNMTLDELNKMFYCIDKNSLTKLRNEINNNEIKIILDKYISLIKFLEYIRKCNDLDKLKSISKKLNDFDKLEILNQNFIGMFENIKYFYGLEINQKLTNINFLKQNENTHISFIKDNNGNDIKFIDSHEEMIFFQYTMNAFGNGRTLENFKKPRLISQTRLCLSLITNNIDGVSRIPIDYNHVTLIFEKINPKSLIIMDSRDINSSTERNSLILLHNTYAEFDVVNDMLEKTKKTNYNEYNIYIENEDGTTIYPTAVKVTGDIPTEAEIEAASTLQIPLIKMHKTKKITHSENKEHIQNESDILKEFNEIFTEIIEEPRKQMKI